MSDRTLLATSIIKALLSDGYTVTIYDGIAQCPINSLDFEEIYLALFYTSYDVICGRIGMGKGKQSIVMTLVYSQYGKVKLTGISKSAVGFLRKHNILT